MPVFGTQNFGSGAVSAYEIANSCIFNDDDSPSLSFTPGSAGNQKTWTLSFWFKISRNAESTSAGMNPFSAGSGNFEFLLSDSNSSFYLIDGGGLRRTNAEFRDMSAWGHMILASDTTQASEGNRMKMYYNGVLITSWAVDNTITLNKDFNINSAAAQVLGQRSGGFWDGYLAEFIFVDGTQLAATALGEFDDNGVWRPIDPSGLTFGTNGYWLDFEDSSALGNDVSGNDNDFTPSNLAAGDQVTDSPTLNYSIMNYNDAHRESSAVLSEGNLKWTNSNTGKANDARATFGISSGKYYWECELDTLGQSGVNREFVGIVSPEWRLDSGSAGTSFPSDSTGYAIATKGDKINGGSTVSYGSAMSAGDIVGVALDLDNGKIWFSINGTYPSSGDPAAGSNEAYSSISGLFCPAFCVDYGTGNSTLIANFGQRSFNTAAPTGFSALNSATLPAPALEDGSTNYQTQLYAGNGSTQSITFGGNSNMQPDIVLLKDRESTYVPNIYDAARGVQKYLHVNTDAVESTDANTLTAFNSDGFSLGTAAWVNGSNDFVSWNWSAGNSGASNEAGGINTTTTYSDATAGISVSTYEGTGSASTIGHGLGVAPKLIMVKNRDATDAWKVYHEGVATDPQTDYLVLNTDAAIVDDATVWNDTAPTSTVFSIGTHTDVNTSGESYVAYAFSEVAGFSRFGAYTGNGNADGPFIYTGFRPAMVIVKPATRADGWIIWDNKRDTYNLTAQYLTLDTSNIEYTGTVRILDILSNGFKIKSSHNSVNNSGDTYVYMAFAENPFGGDGVSPATAR